MAACSLLKADDDWMLIQGRQDRELQWLLDSLQETLNSLRAGVEECLSLLNPSDTPTTLAVSTHLSEAVKGHITRSGISILKGNISLSLPTLPTSPSTHTITTSYPIPPLTSISSLLSESSLLITSILDTHPLTALFLREHLRLLGEQLTLINSTLNGTTDLSSFPPAPPVISSGPTAPPLFIRTSTAASTSTSDNPSSTAPQNNLSPTVLPPTLFNPPLPPSICLTLSLGDGVDAPTFILTARTLAAADAPTLSIRERLGLAQVPKHDESNADVLYGERQVRVREKVRVGVVDPAMVSLGAKVGAMSRVVGGARGRLEVVCDCVEGLKMEG